MADQPQKGRTNWNNVVKIIVALISAGGVVAAAIISAYKTEVKNNSITIDSLLNVIDSQKSRIQALNQELTESHRQKNRIEPASVNAPIQVEGQPPAKIFGDYKIDPLEPFTGNSADGTINFAFNVTNSREDRTINLYTRNSLLIGEDNLTKEGESAQLSNSKVARPKGNTSSIKLMQNHPLRAYIKFKTTERINEVHEMSFYVTGQEIKYSGRYPIKWD